MEKIDLGNNESAVCGAFQNNDGTFIALTSSKSKPFKTEAGTQRWFERNTRD
ncbi:DUF1391 domain-containing protein [Salmonella enterica]|uniref:DUF1391 family protein n=1 Tax=Salmonella enterica TaxID=28901 RepID=UPI000FAACC39|nr:DUF1391 domain-containing protein [Salmonella enterica]EBY6655469.1 DUF1391 domain-containing protein [Salmonella enterica subsp. enterica serovar Oranienburg]EBM3540385.1 DUF1391 domain-containing protein [Salmonella enterica]ECC3821354.1 DUF1391 domain-containing protein [Salmonella enterica]ECC5260196.1 DUF1391 domain-containing protein [Salmonella enterica]